MKIRLNSLVACLCCIAMAMLSAAPAAAQCGVNTISCFLPHSSPGCNSLACCNGVCAIDPFCCSSEWDALCVDRANATCRSGATCADAIWMNAAIPSSFEFNTATGSVGGFSSCADDDARATWRRWVSNCSGQVTLSVCTEFAEGQVVLSVFDACSGSELACGANELNADCGFGPEGTTSVRFGAAEGSDYLIRISTVGAANDSAGTISVNCIACGPGAPSCFSAHNSPGCNDIGCCTQVCSLDPYCCGVAWDSICVATANASCTAVAGATCASAILLNPSIPATYSYNTADGANGGSSSCGSNDDRAVWRRWVASCSGVATVTTCTEFAEGQVVLTVFDACAGNELACGANSGNSDCGFGPDGTSSVSFIATAGLNYYIRISTEGAANDSAGSISVSCSSVLAGAACATAITLDTAVPATYQYNTADGANGGSSSCGTNDDRATWRRWVATCSGAVTVTTCTEFAEGQVVLAVFDSCGGAEIACGSNAGNADCGFGPDGTSSVTFNAAAGQDYFFRISTEGAANDSAGSISVACAGCGGTTESCYAVHATPGCNSAACCSNICAIDPFCCSDSWDIFCVARAESTCRSGTTCGDPILLASVFPSTLEFNTATGTNGGSSSCGIDDNRATWRRVIPACSRAVTLSTCTEFAEGQVVITVFDACNGTEIACGSNASNSDCGFGPDGTVSVTFTGWEARDYLVRISTEGAENDSAGTLALVFGPCIELGDINADGLVNAADLSALLGNWGSGGTSDLNDDGTTNAADLSILLGNWG